MFNNPMQMIQQFAQFKKFVLWQPAAGSAETPAIRSDESVAAQPAAKHGATVQPASWSV